MEEDYIPHKNLEDPSNIIQNSKKEAGNLYNNSNNKFINITEEIKEQNNDYINNLENNIELNENDINTNEDNNIYDNEGNLKFAIERGFDFPQKELIQAKERIKYLTQENISLKNIIANKDKLISDFEDLSLQLKEKFQKLELMNINLKQQLQSKNPINENNLNYDYNDYNKNNYNYKYGEYNKEFMINNPNINNNELIDNLGSIKKELELIENEYQMKLDEKECHIEQLNCEIIKIYKEYVKLSDILEEMNYLVKNSDYNELKTEFNCLLKEKEILLKEKEKNQKEILSLREKFMQEPYDCRGLNKNNEKKSTEFFDMFKEKEKDYINEINRLKGILNEKIKENEELKNRQESIIQEYELKIKNLMENQY